MEIVIQDVALKQFSVYYKSVIELMFILTRKWVRHFDFRIFTTLSSFVASEHNEAKLRLKTL